jgi:hypothetical protein
MPDRTAKAIALALLIALMAIFAWAIYTTTAQCHAIDGTTVRGLFWLECIK